MKKAIILAAGYGRRLMPITEKTPKCLVKINGITLLEIWLNRLSEQGISEILINSHYLNSQVRDFVDGYLQKNKNINIKLQHEETLLGTAGTVWSNQDFIGNDSCLVVNGDNLSNVDTRKISHFHKCNDAIITLTYLEKNNPIGCGIIEMGRKFEITRFEEKPAKAFSNFVYAGIQALRSEVFRLLPFSERRINGYAGLDFGYDVFPKLVGKMKGYKLDCFLMDIGDMSSYCLANNLWAELEN